MPVLGQDVVSNGTLKHQDISGSCDTGTGAKSRAFRACAGLKVLSVSCGSSSSSSSQLYSLLILLCMSTISVCAVGGHCSPSMLEVTIQDNDISRFTKCQAILRRSGCRSPAPLSLRFDSARTGQPLQKLCRGTGMITSCIIIQSGTRHTLRGSGVQRGSCRCAWGGGGDTNVASDHFGWQRRSQRDPKASAPWSAWSSSTPSRGSTKECLRPGWDGPCGLAWGLGLVTPPAFWGRRSYEPLAKNAMRRSSWEARYECGLNAQHPQI